MSTYDYQYIEELLLRLLSNLLGIFTDSEKNEVQDFIDVGEYGLALETLIDIIVEENKQISGESLELACDLAEVMQFNKKVLEEKLRAHVTDS